MKVVGQAALFFSAYSYTPLSTTLTVELGGRAVSVDAGPETELYRPDTDATGVLRDLVLFVLNHRTLASRAMDSQRADGTATFDFDFTLEHDTYAKDLDGRRLKLLSVHVKARAVRNTSKIELTSMAWQRVPAAFGTAVSEFGSTTLTVVEPAPGILSTKVFVSGREVKSYPAEDKDGDGDVEFGPG